MQLLAVFAVYLQWLISVLVSLAFQILRQGYRLICSGSKARAGILSHVPQCCGASKATLLGYLFLFTNPAVPKSKNFEIDEV